MMMDYIYFSKLYCYEDLLENLAKNLTWMKNWLLAVV